MHQRVVHPLTQTSVQERERNHQDWFSKKHTHTHTHTLPAILPSLPILHDELWPKMPNLYTTCIQRDPLVIFVISMRQSFGRTKHRVKETFLFGCTFLLTIEVILLVVCLFYLRWGNHKKNRSNPMPGRGRTKSKKNKPIFHRKQKRPNPVFTVSKADQAEFQP